MKIISNATNRKNWIERIMETIKADMLDFKLSMKRYKPSYDSAVGYRKVDEATIRFDIVEDEDDCFGTILSKFELILIAIGFEMNGKRLALVEYIETTNDMTNVVMINTPKDDE